MKVIKGVYHSFLFKELLSKIFKNKHLRKVTDNCSLDVFSLSTKGNFVVLAENMFFVVVCLFFTLYYQKTKKRRVMRVRKPVFQF